MYHKFVLLSLALAGALSAFSQKAPAQKNASAAKALNIVLFVADDLGATDTGPYGNRFVRTPNLDRLAASSLLFSAAFASSPTCSPSRASLLSGLFPFRNGAHANHTGIREGIRTLPAYLKPLGYKVAIAGKYHIGPMESYPFEMIHGSNVPEPGREGKGVLWTDLNMEPVDKWLEEAAKGKQAFALVVNDHSPHVIWPEEPEYKAEEVDIPPMHIDTRETREARARYYTDVTKMDANLGKLLQSLERHGLAENTIVIFTADQGPQWAFGKWSLYDYGIQVPLLIRWPGKTSGESTGELVSLVDILPTLIESAGGKAPAMPGEIDGLSLLPLLEGEAGARRPYVYASHTGDHQMNRSPMRMVRSKRYKYILNLAPEILYTTHMDKARDHDGGREYWTSWIKSAYQNEHAAAVLWRYHNRPKEELYDVIADPRESRNLAALPQYAGVLEEFREEMTRWRSQQGDQETGPSAAEAPKGGKPVAPYIFK